MTLKTLTRFILFFSVIAVSATSYLDTINNENSYGTKFSKLQLKNLAVLTGDETGDDGIEGTDTPEGIPTTREDCLRAGGNWNMASVAEDSGFETVKCEYSGKISIFGITLEGSYTKGDKYKIPWVRYKCVPSESNCCIKQGLYTGETKVA